MKQVEQKLERHFKKESDEMLFNDMKFDASQQKKVVDQLNKSSHSEAGVKRTASIRSKWVYGAAAAVIMLVIAVSVPNFGNTDITPPISNPGGSEIPGGQTGTSLTELKTVVVQTLDEAKGRFGADLVAPSYVPGSFSLDSIETTGMDADIATRAVFLYKSGDQEFTYMADRTEATIPLEFFTEIEVNGAAGYIFVQPNMIELFWTVDGVQYALGGSITEEEALAIAASLE